MENKKHRVLKLLTVGTLISSIFSSAGFINAQETLEPEDSIVEEEGLEAEGETVEETEKEQPVEEEVEEVSEEPKEEVTEEPKEQNAENPVLRNELLRDEATEVATGTWGTSEWSLDSEGTLTIGAGTFALSDNVDNRPTWYENRDNITKIIFNDEVMANESSVSLFENLTNLQVIENIDNLNTSRVTDMQGMFNSCKSLTSLDVSSWDTSNVTSIRSMFGSCESLTELDLSTWNMSSVTIMRYAISGCKNLKILNMNNWNVNSLTSLYGAFSNNASLESLDLSTWQNTGSITDMAVTFDTNQSLKYIDLSNWDTSNVATMAALFRNSPSLETLKVDNWDTTSVTTMGNMFYGCTSLKSLDLSSWDDSNVTTMENMFYNNTSLESLDISNFEMIKVTTTSGMFQNCTCLKSIDTSDWDMGKVTNFKNMFNNCIGLTTLEVSNWDTSSVTTFDSMFSGCSNLESIDVSNWNTNNVTILSSMFYNCSSLTSLDFSGWNTSKVTGKNYVLSNCSKLSSITLGENSVFAGAMGLSNIATSGTNYTGRWVGLNEGVAYANTSTFLRDYNGSNPDTYVWEGAFNVDFNTDGANAITSQTITTTGKVTEPDEPTKLGYTFMSWYTDSEYKNEWDFNTEVTESMTLYARFKVINYTLSFKEGSNDFTDWSSTYSTLTKYTVEDHIILPTANDMDVASNKVFAGWYEDESLSGNPILDIATGTTENKTYYAKFVDGTTNYSIQYFEGEDTFTNWKDGFSATIIYSNNETQAIDLPDASQIEKRGYAFDGWYDNPDLEGSEVTEIAVEETGTKKFYAKFVAIEYAINFKEGSSNFTGWASNYNDAPAIYTIEDEITLPTASNLSDKDGYTFAGWYDNENFEGEAVTTISEGSIGEKAYYAKYEVNNYNITFMDGSSEVTNWTSGYTVPTSYTVEGSVTLPKASNLVEKTGYTFVGWYDNESLSGNAVTSISTGATGNKTYYAKYEVVPYTITFMNDNEAITSWNDYTAPSSYNIESTTITLPTSDDLVAHSEGYVFAGWYENAELTGSPVTTIETGSTGDKVYYASYTNASITITDDFRTDDGVILATGDSYELKVLLNGEVISDEELAKVTWSVELTGGFIGNVAQFATIEDGTTTINLLRSGAFNVTANYQGVEYSIVIVKSGDVDKNRQTNETDIARLIRYLESSDKDLTIFGSNTEYIEFLADINGDGRINDTDTAEFTRLLEQGGN